MIAGVLAWLGAAQLGRAVWIVLILAIVLLLLIAPDDRRPSRLLSGAERVLQWFVIAEAGHDGRFL